MIETLQNIQNRINEVTELKYVDEDCGQLDSYSPHPPTQWPCALIDFSQIDFSNIGKDKRVTPQSRQQGAGTIMITVANMKLTNTSFKAPQAQKNNAWSIHIIIGKIHEKIQGYRPEEMSGVLIRTRFQKVKRDDGIQEYRIYYSIGLNNV